MSRELIVQLIKKKKALYQEQHDLALEELAVDKELAYCAPDNEAALDRKLFEVNAKKLSVQSKLNRAQLFGLRFAKSFVPSICITCFIDHNKSSPMSEIESKLKNDIRQFRCPNCSNELSVEPPIGSP